MSRTKRKGDSRHIRLYHWVLASPAWRELSVVGRALYLELADRYFGNNNGRIVFSVRQAADGHKLRRRTGGRIRR